MTKAHDIRQLIAEQAAGPAQRRAAEHVAEGLERTLAKDVPARPEFKAQLRRQLMAQARRTMTPWYRRPAVWGSTFGVAAAVAVLAVGLSMFQEEPGQQPGGSPTSPAPIVAIDPGAAKTVVPGLTSLPGDPPIQPALADVAVQAGARPESPAPDVSAGLNLLRMSGNVDRQQLADMAGRLGLFAQVAESGGTFRVTENGRSLSLNSQYLVAYEDTRPESPGAAKIAGAEAAKPVARRFLEELGIPVPNLQPSAAPLAYRGTQAYEVVFTPRVAGRPVVNGQTRVVVSETGRVLTATTYAPASYEEKGPVGAISAAEAVTDATRRGGNFSGADLVWVQAPDASGRSVYLQPYWRVYGSNAQGTPVARFVPAMKR